MIQLPGPVVALLAVILIVVVIAAVAIAVAPARREPPAGPFDEPDDGSA